MAVQTLFVEPDSSRETGYDESFNGKLRAERLIGEIFYTLRKAQVMIERWGQGYKIPRFHRPWDIVHQRQRQF